MITSTNLPQKLLPSDIAVVSENGWLAECGPAFRTALLKLASARHFFEGEILYHYGDPAEGIFAVVFGALSVTVPADDGQEFVAHRDGVGFWIGDLAMLANQTRLVSVVATRDTRTLFVTNTQILEMIEKTPTFYREFFALTHNNMKLALRILANLAVTRTDHRVVLRLLHLEETLGSPGAWLKLSQEELAAMVAVSIPTIQRQLQRLAAQGLVELGYSQLRITDRAALITLCQS